MISVRHVDLDNNSILFQSDLPDLAQQLAELGTPDAEEQFVKEARKELKITGIGISQQMNVYVDSKEGKIVPPRNPQTPEEAQALKDNPIIAVRKVDFASIGD